LRGDGWIRRASTRSSTSPIPASVSPSTPLCMKRIGRCSPPRPRPPTLTGKFCQPTTVQWALDTWALGNAVGRTITKMGGSTWYFISFDYALGKALATRRDRSDRQGGADRCSARLSHPLGATDFGSYLLQAQASGRESDSRLPTPGPTQSTPSARQPSFQIVGPDRRLAALFLQITDIDALGLNAAQGLILSEAFLLGSQRFDARLRLAVSPNG